jgi:hypothetical protein
MPEKQKNSSATLSQRVLERYIGADPTPEQLSAAQNIIDRVTILIDFNNETRRKAGFQPYRNMIANGISTHNIPKGHEDEKINSSGLREDANSTVGIELTESGVGFSEHTQEWVNNGGQKLVRTKERCLFIDNDGLTLFWEHMTPQVDNDTARYFNAGNLEDSYLRHSPGVNRIPLIESEQVFAEHILSSFELHPPEIA